MDPAKKKGKHSVCLRIPAGAPNRAWHQSFHHLGCAVQRCVGVKFRKQIKYFGRYGFNDYYLF